MKITLKKKFDNADKSPLLVMIEHPRDANLGQKDKKYAKAVFSVGVGEVVDMKNVFPDLTPDEATALGHHILSKYPGLFEQGESAKAGNVAPKKYLDKSLSAEA